ncbi:MULTISPECIES: hypothetical protein [Protofrankia]|uniref:hypothetical protein n=1 Tax=Protofrankia TaxID=2994361 RepID=UPI001ED914F3|nr:MULTISPECIES: hypothetical protein [Protofrankia]
MERLLAWATDTSASSARHLCALLGDVSMGKTTTVKLFAQALLNRRDDDRSAPLPILFDLRDLPPALAREGRASRRSWRRCWPPGTSAPARPPRRC